MVAAGDINNNEVVEVVMAGTAAGTRVVAMETAQAEIATGIVKAAVLVAVAVMAAVPVEMGVAAIASKVVAVPASRSGRNTPPKNWPTPK